MNRFKNVSFTSFFLLMSLVMMFAAVSGCEQKVTITPEIQKVITYKFGESREPLEDVEDIVRDSYGDSALRLNLEKQFAAILSMDEATYEAKDFACRQLMFIGTDESVKEIAALLPDEKLSDMARYALEQNTSPAVDKALIKALNNTEGLQLVGIINTISNRRNANAIDSLQKFTSNSNAQVAKAAAAAIAKLNSL